MDCKQGVPNNFNQPATPQRLTVLKHGQLLDGKDDEMDWRSLDYG